MYIRASSRDRPSNGSRIVIAMAALPTALLLCAFMKPQLPQAIYDGTRHDTLIETYRRAYRHIGMTKMKVLTESTSKAPDGTVSTVSTYTFACPSAPGSHAEPCGATFGISANVKDDICRDCRVTRTGYSGDPAANEKAIAEIRRVLGENAPSPSAETN